MLVLSAIFSILGLIFDAIAGLVLLPKIFITDQELNLSWFAHFQGGLKESVRSFV